MFILLAAVAGCVRKYPTDTGADGGEKAGPLDLLVSLLDLWRIPSSWRLHSGLVSRGFVFNFSSFDRLKIPHCN